MKAKLTINCGSMFSGKSSELLRQGERHMLAGHKVTFIKPTIDNRYSEDKIVNHKGQSIEAISVKQSIEILQENIVKNDVILIDEVQFFDNYLIKVISDLLKQNKTIYCSGLDMDFEGTPFEITSQLMAMADEVNKFRAVCDSCGEDANFSYKLTDSKSQIELGEKDKYIPLCRKCYYLRMEQK